MSKKEKFPVEPTGARVIVESIAAKEQRTVHGLIIPGIGKEMPRGLVLAVGPDFNFTNIKVGDTVLYAESAGYPFKYQDKSYFILYQIDVLAKDGR